MVVFVEFSLNLSSRHTSKSERTVRRRQMLRMRTKLRCLMLFWLCVTAVCIYALFYSATTSSASGIVDGPSAGVGLIIAPADNNEGGSLRFQKEFAPAQATINARTTTTKTTTPSNDGLDRSSSADNAGIRRLTDELVLSVVACGERLNDTIVVLKSAVALSRGRRLRLIVVADDDLRPAFVTEFARWPVEIRQRVRMSVHPLDFPKDGTADEWRNLFKLCASQRLFLPSLLRDVDATLYVDTDVVFLRPLDEIWRFFEEMNSTQLAAMAPENEDFATGWYNRFAQHPYYKPLGVNSGVMLMNLTRIRQIDWERELVDLHKKYKQKITWGDQDLLNIFFHRHPEKLFVYPCEWNYRTDHCMYASICHSAEKHGVAVAHGSRNVFHGIKQPTFRAIFETFQQYELGEDLRTHLLEPLRRNLQQTLQTNCGKMYRIFLKSLEKYV